MLGYRSRRAARRQRQRLGRWRASFPGAIFRRRLFHREHSAERRPRQHESFLRTHQRIQSHAIQQQRRIRTNRRRHDLHQERQRSIPRERFRISAERRLGRRSLELRRQAAQGLQHVRWKLRRSAGDFRKLMHGKAKTFFFADFEANRRRYSTPLFLFVPTNAMRQGDFSALSTPLIDPFTGKPYPGNKIPSGSQCGNSQDCISPVTQSLLNNYLPAPNIACERGEFRITSELPAANADAKQYEWFRSAIRSHHHVETIHVRAMELEETERTISDGYRAEHGEQFPAAGSRHRAQQQPHRFAQLPDHQ